MKRLRALILRAKGEFHCLLPLLDAHLKFFCAQAPRLHVTAKLGLGHGRRQLADVALQARDLSRCFSTLAFEFL